MKISIKNLKLQQKILVIVLGISLIIYIAVLSYITINAKKRTVEDTETLVKNYAQKYAKEIEKQLNKDMETIETLGESVKSYKIMPNETWKEVFKNMYGHVFKNNEQFFAIWDSWELSHIDTTWDKPYGRYSYEYYRENGRIKQGSELMSLDGDPDMYKRIKNLNKQVIEEPYLYSYTEQKADEILMTSLIEPIQENGKFIGVVGADISLRRYQKLISEIEDFKSNEAYLLSNQGAIIGHTNEDLLGKKINKVWSKKNSQYKIVNNIKEGKEFTFSAKNEQGNKAFYAFAPIHIGVTETPWALGISVPYKLLTEKATKNTYVYIIFGLIGLLITGFAVARLSNYITRPIRKITGILKKLARGNIDDSMKTDINTGDEIEEMAEALNTSVEELNKKTNFAEKIKEGDLEHQFNLASEEDKLGQSLIEMRDSLKKAREEEEKRKIEDEKRRWVNEGLAKFADILRQNNDNLEELSYNVLKNLVKYIEGNQGGIFLINDEDKENIRYELTAAYAYNRRKYLEKTYRPGEGLIGTCAVEQKTIYMTDLPDNYINITSGLGASNPRSLLIVPLKTEEEILGILELASFEKFEDYQINFVERVAESIASTVSSVRTNIKTSELLEKSQQQAEEMSSQEEEMRQNMEELQATQEEAARREREMSYIIDTLDTTVGSIEMDLQGKITKVNTKYAEMAEMNKEEIEGKNLTDFMDQQKAQSNEFKKVWEELRKGNKHAGGHQYIFNQKEKWFHETFTPIKDQNQQITKILVFSTDISYVRQLEEENKKLRNK
jgi:methyl-accepting chemotaxis protein